MSYDPSRTPIAEAILQNVQTTLAAMAAPSYAITPQTVRRWNANQLTTVNEHPAIIIVPLDHTDDDSRTYLVEHELKVALVLALRQDGWPALINRFLAEVRVALCADPSRGALAVTTRIGPAEVYDSDPAQNVGGAQLLVSIVYRTRYDDPTTAT